MAASVGFATCIVDGCDRAVGLKGARGYCPLHYQRIRRGAPIEGRGCLTCGTTIVKGKFCSEPCKPRCSVEDCSEPVRKRGWCSAHYTHWRRTGDPATPFRWKWNSDDVTYSAVHERLRRRQPSQYVCRHCGNTAQQWAYDHEDPNEKRDTLTGLVYSTDGEHYMPLCASCHKRFDLAAKGAASGVKMSPGQGGD